MYQDDIAWLRGCVAAGASVAIVDPPSRRSPERMLSLRPVAICLAVLRSMAAADDPLSCFGTPKPGARNICVGSYKEQFPHVATASDCAEKCLADHSCVQFVFARSASTQPNCRLSSTCKVGTKASSDWDAYFRKGPASSGPCASPELSFAAPLFSDGMILQRDSPGVKVWGTSLSNGSVTVRVLDASGNDILSSGSGQVDSQGFWVVELKTPVPARTATILSAVLQRRETPGGHIFHADAETRLHSVAWGETLVCGGQSNMAFGICGANSPTQSPTAALASLPVQNPIRFYFQSGSIGGGAAGSEGGIQCQSSKPPRGNPWCNVSANVCHTNVTSSTPSFQWFNATAANAGSTSAVCILTAQRLHSALGGHIPVGAVESCVGGTPVEPWTPPNGTLFDQHIRPLLPFRFAAALYVFCLVFL